MDICRSDRKPKCLLQQSVERWVPAKRGSHALHVLSWFALSPYYSSMPLPAYYVPCTVPFVWWTKINAFTHGELGFVSFVWTSTTFFPFQLSFNWNTLHGFEKKLRPPRIKINLKSVVQWNAPFVMAFYITISTHWWFCPDETLQFQIPIWMWNSSVIYIYQIKSSNLV